jgi:hypothetical protein
MFIGASVVPNWDNGGASDVPKRSEKKPLEPKYGRVSESFTRNKHMQSALNAEPAQGASKSQRDARFHREGE